jgi:hypothetical protein
MAFSQTMVVTPTTLATGTIKRTVHDEIRRFNPNITPFLSLVKEGNVDNMGEQQYSNGLISKEATPTMKFEWFTYTPISLLYEATGGTGGATGTFTVADNTMWRTRDIVTNITQGFVVGIVTEVNADTVTVSVTKVGDDNWAASAGDVICMSCRTMEEGTSDITPLTKELDNNYNTVFPFRYSVSIADTAVGSPHFTEKPLQRYMKDNMTFCLANMENALLFGRRATSGNTTSVTIGGTVFPMFTTRGLLNFAGNTIDGSGMTWDKFVSTTIEQLPNTLNPETPLIALMGRHSLAKFQGWSNQNFIHLESGKKDEFGIVVKKFLAGPYTIIPRVHNSYDQLAGNPLRNVVTIFPPDDLTYMYKTDMDLETKDNLQNPGTWGTTRAIQGVFGLRSLSAGSSITNITNFS